MKFNIITFTAVSFFVLYAPKCTASLNLYLGSQEVQRLLGLPAEVYYIRDDLINSYAMNFTFLVPPKINDLYFTWENSGGQKIPYTIEVKSSNRAAIPEIHFNISSSGYIVPSSQTFVVSFPCSGSLEAEVHITIIMNITFPNDDVKTLRFFRKKTCLYENTSNFTTSNTLPQFANSSNIFYIAISCVVTLICVLGISMTVYCAKDEKSRRMDSVGNGTGTTATAFLAALPRNSVSASSYGSFRRMPSYSLLDGRYKDLQERIAELTVQRCRVRLSSIILEGTFGRVYQGSFTSEEGLEETVIIKTVADHASQVQISLLLQEGMSMYSLNHKNILSIMRVSIEDHTTPYLLYPFNNSTNLKIFLQKCKVSSEGVQHTLTTQEVVHMALQIIKAMQYLHRKHLLHKDLAARNCVTWIVYQASTDNEENRDTDEIGVLACSEATSSKLYRGLKQEVDVLNTRVQLILSKYKVRHTILKSYIFEDAKRCSATGIWNKFVLTTFPIQKTKDEHRAGPQHAGHRWESACQASGCPVLESVEVAAPNLDVIMAFPWDSVALFEIEQSIESENSSTHTGLRMPSPVASAAAKPSSTSCVSPVPGPSVSTPAGRGCKRSLPASVDIERKTRVRKVERAILQEQELYNLRKKILQEEFLRAQLEMQRAEKDFLRAMSWVRITLVDDKLNVQVADNALSRDLFPSDYHCLGDNENRPIKWLALESLLHKTFSPASDVWSLGVLLWELTTLAQQPYIEIDPFEMAAYLKDGYRLAQPVNCPDELFAVMAYCWAMSAEERPTFTQLHVCLQEFFAQLTKYV